MPIADASLAIADGIYAITLSLRRQLIRRQIDITPFLAAFFRDDFALLPLLSAAFISGHCRHWPDTGFAITPLRLLSLRHIDAMPLPYIFIFIISRRQLSAIIIFATLPLHFRRCQRRLRHTPFAITPWTPFHCHYADTFSPAFRRHFSCRRRRYAFAFAFDISIISFIFIYTPLARLAIRRFEPPILIAAADYAIRRHYFRCRFSPPLIFAADAIALYDFRFSCRLRQRHYCHY
jgi:hypothetical protein